MGNNSTEKQHNSRHLKANVILPFLLKLYKTRKTVDQAIEDAEKLNQFIESDIKQNAQGGNLEFDQVNLNEAMEKIKELREKQSTENPYEFKAQVISEQSVTSISDKDSQTIKNDVCEFNDIEQGKFFIHEGITLCRFGSYGMGIGKDGKIAMTIPKHTKVIRVNDLKDLEY